jgi:phosphoribosyl 1,2-cyclic phosphate phosphodiesterase
MTIHLLGTGGASGVPAPFSDSRVSRYARLRGGREVRSRTSANVDGQLQLDFGPDTWGQLVRAGLDATRWAGIVFTHADSDHFAVDELQYALCPFTPADHARFALFGNNVVVAEVARRYPDWPFEIHQTESFVPFELAEYRITPVKANHGSPDEDTQNLLIESLGKTLLYATDTGIWDAPTWEFLSGVRLDALVLECSEGFELTPYTGHLDIEEFAEVLARLRDQGTVTDATQVVSTHHSDGGNATYEELADAFGKMGVVAGYDGLVLEV